MYPDDRVAEFAPSGDLIILSGIPPRVRVVAGIADSFPVR